MKAERVRLILDVTSTVAVTCASVVLILIAAGGRAQRGQAPRRGPEIQTVDLETTSTPRPAGAGPSMPDATIIEFSDFQCPFCGQYVRTTYPQLRRDFVDSNIVGYEFRHFPLDNIHPFALKASEAAECARKGGKYWEMHDQLLANQDKLAEPQLIEYASG
jgi:protein-disulfide isomerase